MVAKRRAGIREARQNLSTLIEEVKKGRDILITDRGKPVARLAPPLPKEGKPFASRRSFRRRMPVLNPALSAGIVEEREDRI
ncbi:MAG: type II toxin-antitoxin system Phd/YefM family antitoxin [Acidobacteriota bacterium]